MAKTVNKARSTLKVDVDSVAGKIKYDPEYKAHVIDAMENGEEPMSRADWEKARKAKK